MTILFAKVLLKLASLWGPIFIPWLAALVMTDRDSTLPYKCSVGCKSEVDLSKRGRPRPTDTINELSEQVMDLQARLRDFQQHLAALAAQVRLQTQQPRSKTEAA